MDEQERTHCRVDFHKVLDGVMEHSAFVERWGKQIDEWLLFPVTDIEALEEENEDHKKEIIEKDSTIDDLRAAMRLAVDGLEAAL